MYTGTSQLLLLRFNPDGTPDNQFGGGSGSVLFGYQDYEVNICGDLLLLPDGRIVVAGMVRPLARAPEEMPVPKNKVYLFRRSGDGSLDTSFGDGLGAVQTPVAPARQFDLALQSDKILLASMNPEYVCADLLINRFGSDGALDPSFGGGGGSVLLPGKEFCRAEDRFDLAVQGGGKIVASGWDKIWRLTPEGIPDPTFGSGTGLVVIPAWARSLALQGEKYLVAGVVGNLDHGDPNHVLGFTRNPESPQGRLVLQRYLPEGGLDASFGDQGTTIYDSQSLDPSALALQPADGGILVAGTRRSRSVWPDLLDTDAHAATRHILCRPGGEDRVADARCAYPLHDGRDHAFGHRRDGAAKRRYDIDRALVDPQGDRLEKWLDEIDGDLRQLRVLRNDRH